MTRTARTVALAAGALAAALLFLAGALVAAADSGDPTSTDPAVTTTAPAATSTPDPGPTTTAPSGTTAPLATTTAPLATPPTTTAPTTTTAPVDPWAAFLAWLWARLHPQGGTGAQASTPPQATGAAGVPAGTSSSSPSTSSSSPETSSSTAAVAAAAVPAAVQAARLVVTAHTDSDAGSGALVVGSTVDYTFGVANQGGRATSATLVDRLPSQLALIDAEADQGSCSGTQQVRCALGSIAPGRTVTVAVVVQVTAATAFQNPIGVTGDAGVRVDAPAGVLTLTAGGARPVTFATAGPTHAKAKPKHQRAKPTKANPKKAKSHKAESHKAESHKGKATAPRPRKPAPGKGAARRA